MNAKENWKSFSPLLCLIVVAAGTSLIGCGKKAADVSKSESAQIHAPLGQPMPPQAREAMAKAMSKRPAAGAPAVPAPPGPK